ncbi:MAG: putative metallopeptidase [Pyrinomonadaceae bacterium]
MPEAKLQLIRPRPPELLLEPYVGIDFFVPAPELEEWARLAFLSDDSPLFNEDHIHLSTAHIGYLWTNVPNEKAGQIIAATCEIPFFRGNAWQKHRQIMQMQEWFGDIPDAVITFDARLADICSDLQFCGRADHELYHIRHAVNKLGEPLFDDAGQPKFAPKGHDVEEHTGIMRRYGPGGCAGDTIAFIEASMRAPEIGEIELIGVCGSC